MLKRPGILALLSAIAATTGLSLMMAPASYAPAKARQMGPSLIEPADSMCVQADPASGGAGIQLDEEWHQPGNPAGLWYLRSLGNGNYHVRNYGNGRCVRTTGSKDNSAVWA